MAGRLSDRFGRLAPIRGGLVAAAVLLALVCLPGDPLLLAAALVLLVVGMSFLWAPAMAVASDAAEGSGLRQGIAFGLVNLAWAGGQTVGSAGSGALAGATSDAVPFLIAAALSLVALAALGTRTSLTAVPRTA